MAWIICTIISVICLKFTLHKNPDGSLKIKDPTIGNIVAIVVFSVIAVIQFGVGINVYPSLAGNLAEVKTLEKRIVDIKASKYTYEKDGKLIAGSIENYKQSTNLSEFITTLAVKEANYSKALRRAKTHKEVFALYFFGYGWSISDKINQLKTID